MHLKITKTKTGEHALTIVLNTPFALNETYTIHHAILTEKEFEWFKNHILNKYDEDNLNLNLSGVNITEIEDGWIIEEEYNKLVLTLLKSNTKK